MKPYSVGHYDKPSPWVILLLIVISFLLMLSDETWENIATWIINMIRAL